MKFLMIALMALSLNACIDTSQQNKDVLPADPSKPTTPNKITAGNSLTITCPDSFNQTQILIRATWEAGPLAWRTSIQETDTSGKYVRSPLSLWGRAPENPEDLQMAIYNGSTLYARVIQSNTSAAIYNDGIRTLNCTFY